MDLYGRDMILTDQKVVDKENVLSVLNAAITVHDGNKRDIEYLYNYYKGKQPIKSRVKEVREEINNIVEENHASEIVDFKVGYTLGEPIQYIARTDGSGVDDEISKLNEYVLSEDKPAKDRELLEWNQICGTAYRIILPDANADDDMDEAPFEIYTLDPRQTFIVRLNDLGNPPVMAVTFVKQQDGTTVYSCYTNDRFFRVSIGDDGETGIEELPNALGIPIIEYPANNARMGAFEKVLDLLDALNTVQSNRVDGVEQFIQSFILFHNVDIDEEKYDALRVKGLIKVQDPNPQMKGDVKMLTSELNQTQVQTLKDDIYDMVLVICGMPNRNGGSSTSDTGKATYLRDGFAAAEVQAKATETIFSKSENECLRKILKICKDLSGLNLKPSAVKIHFTRRNYENITEKATVLTMMLGSDKIAPRLAFSHCGMFADPEMAYKMSEEYTKEQERKAAENAERSAEAEPGGGSGDKRDPEIRKARGDRSEA